MLYTLDLAYAFTRSAPIFLPDIALSQGQVLVLQGASGSGKSTFLALACGLITPSAGQLQVAGQDLSAMQGAKRDFWRGRNVGFLPQRLFLSEALNVFDNLALCYFAAGLAQDTGQIVRCLNALGVADLAQRMPSQLSGGQAQRVALARAVLLSPKIILADEPTASLDDTAAAQAIGLLVEQARRCTASLVIATHDARVVQVLHTVKTTFQTIKISNKQANSHVFTA